MTVEIFKTGEKVEITGMQRDCECFHCGRPLKIGVVLEGFGGAFGAQCLASASEKQKVTIGGVMYTNKLSTDAIKQRAIAAHRGENNVHGWTVGSEVFKVVLKKPLNAK